ncbi:hypothetical protein MED222_06095 [Vibrio sp. MED222]|nr:hypothetical protein MED222_06095 [Vibrio sp. MED222]
MAIRDGYRFVRERMRLSVRP